MPCRTSTQSEPESRTITRYSRCLGLLPTRTSALPRATLQQEDNKDMQCSRRQAAKVVLHKYSLVLGLLHHPLLHAAPRHQHVHHDGPLLAEPVSPRVRLQVVVRVPVAAQHGIVIRTGVNVINGSVTTLRGAAGAADEPVRAFVSHPGSSCGRKLQARELNV